MKAILAVVFVTALFFATNTALGQTKPAAPAMNVLVGVATANDAQAALTVRLAELLTKYSNGRIAASARTGGALGTQTQMLATLQAGALACMVIPTGNLTSAVLEMGLFDLPFLLPGGPARMSEFTRRSKFAARMKEMAEQKDIHVIGFFGVGSTNLLTRFPITKLADIQGKLFRVIPSPPRAGAYKDWGAVPRTMELAELYSALQQATVVGMDGASDIIYRMKFYEVARYLTRTEHSGFLNTIIFSKKWFDTLPKDLQSVADRVGREGLILADELNTKADSDALEAMKKDRNVVYTELPASEIEKMKALSREGIWKSMRSGSRVSAMMDLLEQDLASYQEK